MLSLFNTITYIAFMISFLIHTYLSLYWVFKLSRPVEIHYNLYKLKKLLIESTFLKKQDELLKELNEILLLSRRSLWLKWRIRLCCNFSNS
jgi:hypothetical protein